MRQIGELSRHLQLFAVAAGSADSLAADRSDHRCRYQPLSFSVQHPRFRPRCNAQRHKIDEGCWTAFVMVIGKFKGCYLKLPETLSTLCCAPRYR